MGALYDWTDPVATEGWVNKLFAAAAGIIGADASAVTGINGNPLEPGPLRGDERAPEGMRGTAPEPPHAFGGIDAFISSGVDVPLYDNPIARCMLEPIYDWHRSETRDGPKRLIKPSTVEALTDRTVNPPRFLVQFHGLHKDSELSDDAKMLVRAFGLAVDDIATHMQKFEGFENYELAVKSAANAVQQFSMTKFHNAGNSSGAASVVNGLNTVVNAYSHDAKESWSELVRKASERYAAEKALKLNGVQPHPIILPGP